MKYVDIKHELHFYVTTLLKYTYTEIVYQVHEARGGLYSFTKYRTLNVSFDALDSSKFKAQIQI